MQYEFGTGQIYGRSLSSNIPTPVQFGALQGVSIDISFTQKELYSQYQFPIALARGTAKITGKADFAQFNAQLFNDMFFGSTTVTSGAVRTVNGEAKIVTANIVTATNGGNFIRDLGVTLAATGAIFTRVANSPVGLQYSVAETTGVYTFNASQNNVPVLINYNWNDTATGKSLVITNQLLGLSPQFMCVFTQNYAPAGVNKMLTLVLNSCMSSKLSLATKLEDFTIPSFDFSAYADASNNLMSLNLEE